MFRRMKRNDADDSAPGVDSLTPNRRRLGDILLEEGIITPKQLEEALERQKETGAFLGQTLVELGHIQQDVLLTFLVKQCRIPHINLLDYHIAEDILSLMPAETCFEHGVLPIDRLGKILTVAMVDPLDDRALELVRTACPDLKIKPILCEYNHFIQVASRLFKRSQESAEETSMASFGLAALRHLPPQEEAPAPPPEPILPQEEEENEAIETALETAPPRHAYFTQGPAIDTQELARAVGASVHGAMQDAALAIAEQVRRAAERAPASTTPSAADIAAIMRESVREAMRDSLSSITPRASDAPEATMRAVVSEMRATLQDAMKEAMSTVVKSAPPAGPSPKELAQVMHGSLRDAMREALGDMAQMLRAQSLLSKAETAGQPETELNREPLGGAAIEALETIQLSQAAQEARMAQLTEAAMQAAQAAQAAIQTAMASQENQTAQLLAATQAAQEAASRAEKEAQRAADQVEIASVSTLTRRSLQHGGLAQRKRRQAAALLGKTEQDILEAMEGPGVKLHIDDRIQMALESESPLAGYTFDTFFCGKANAFALRLSTAVAANPGESYNPFFVHGDVGLGKTHLINAIGNAILQSEPDASVGFVSSSRFARKLMDALQERTLDEFRENYCQWDVLIFDDIQFLGGRIEAQEEFFHIFNTLHEEGRQIIIAGDKAPDRLGQLEKRLVSRFGSGIVTCLVPPEWETRLSILRHQVKQASANVPEELLVLIATRVSSDVRKMTGALRKIIAYADLMGQTVTADLVGEILGHIGEDVTE